MSNDNLSIYSNTRPDTGDDDLATVGELLRCHNYACSYETRTETEKCPMCGRNMLTGRHFRMLGGVLVGMGSILMTMGGALIYFLLDKLPKNDERSSVAFFIFVAILSTGVIATAVGTFQIITGNKNRVLTVALLLSFSVIITVALLSRGIF